MVKIEWSPGRTKFKNPTFQSLSELEKNGSAPKTKIQSCNFESIYELGVFS